MEEKENDESFGMASLALNPATLPVQRRPSPQELAVILGDWVTGVNDAMSSSASTSSNLQDEASTSAAGKDWDLDANSTVPRRRKRKLEDGFKSSLLDTPVCRKFAGDLAQSSMQIYEAMRCNEDFLELQFEFTSSSKLRKLVQVSSEWQKVAYKVIRRRIGNRPFTLLWAVSPSTANPIDLQTHFHPSYMEGSGVKAEAIFDPFGWRQQKTQPPLLNKNSAGSNSEGVFVQNFWAKTPNNAPSMFRSNGLEVNQNKGYLSIARVKELEAVRTILMFGNPLMESELISTDEREMPRINVIVTIIGYGIFYTTPDFQKVGNSFVGLEGKKYEMVRKDGGKFLSSLCLPKSPFLSIEILPFTSALDSVKYLRRQYTNPYHTTKALLIFKMFEDPEVDNWIHNVILKQNHKKTIPMITGQYSFVGSNKLDDGSIPSGAIAIRIMGDKYASVFVTTIEIRSGGIEDLNFKFQQIMEFINMDIITEDGRGNVNIEKKSLFALMFCSMRAEVCVTNEDKAAACHPVDVIAGKFHEIFPSIPIHGLISDKEIFCEEVKPTFYDANCNVSSVSQVKCDQVLPGAKDSIETACNKLVILIVKYPQKNRIKQLGRMQH